MTQDFCYHLNLPFAIDVNWLQDQQSKISGHDRIVNILMLMDRITGQVLTFQQAKHKLKDHIDFKVG